MRSRPLSPGGGKKRMTAVRSSTAATAGCLAAAFVLGLSPGVFAMGGGGDGPFDQLMIELMYRDHPELLKKQRNDNGEPPATPRALPAGDGQRTGAGVAPSACCANSETNGTASDRKEQGE